MEDDEDWPDETAPTVSVETFSDQDTCMQDEERSDLDSDLVEQTVEYIRNKCYPDGTNESRKRVIRKKAKRFEVRDGVLLYKHTRKTGGKKVVVLLTYIQSSEERQKILHACHVDPTAGHLGRVCTLFRIKERFMWTGMYKDVQDLVQKCDVCQHMNRKLTTGTPCLNPIPVKSPWYMIGIDFVGPVHPVASDGSEYILTITDYFTKWAEAVTTIDKSAVSVAHALFKVFMRMGLPKVVVSDNGKEFDNQLDNNLMDLLGIKRRLTTPYHPQANGLVERYNQTLQGMLAKYVSSSTKNDWSSFIDTCVFAYNTSRHESSKFTPFNLMFGRCATLPIDLDISRTTPEEDASRYHSSIDPDMSDVEEERTRRLEVAKRNIASAQEKQKQDFDRRHAKPHLFQEGQLVLKKDFLRKRRYAGKLDSRYVGPYKINKVIGKGTYELVGEDGTTLRATGSHLKPYFQSSDATTHSFQVVSSSPCLSAEVLTTSQCSTGSVPPLSASMAGTVTTFSPPCLLAVPSIQAVKTSISPSSARRTPVPRLVTLVTHSRNVSTSLSRVTSVASIGNVQSSPATVTTLTHCTTRPLPTLVTLVTRSRNVVCLPPAAVTSLARISTVSSSGYVACSIPVAVCTSSSHSTSAAVACNVTAGMFCPSLPVASTSFSQISDIIFTSDVQSALPEVYTLTSSPSSHSSKRITLSSLFSCPSVLLKVSPFQLTHSHFNQLINGDWLHVELIEVYLALMSLCSCSNVNCVVLPSHIMDLAESAGIDSMHPYGEKLVETITHGGLVIMPVFDDLRQHFILLVVNSNTQNIEVFDSNLLYSKWCASSRATHHVRRLRVLLQGALSSKSDVDVSTWNTLIHEDIPQQQDGASCGVFACKFGKCLIQGSANEKITFKNDSRTLRMEVASDLIRSLEVHPYLCPSDDICEPRDKDSISGRCTKCNFLLPSRELELHTRGCSPCFSTSARKTSEKMYLSDDVKLFLGQCDNQFTYLTVADMRTLYRGNCLNDQVINFYMFLLNLEEKKRVERSRNALHVMSTSRRTVTYCASSFFYTSVKMYMKNKETSDPNSYLKVKLSRVSRLLVPICHNDHWVLLEFNFSRHKVISYNSLNYQFASEGVFEIGEYLSEVFQNKYGKQMLFSEWHKEPSFDVTLQSNSTDCGVLLCKNANALVRCHSVSCVKFDTRRKSLFEEIVSSPVVHKQVHCDNIDLFAVWMREVKTVFGDLLINKGEMHNCQCKSLDAAVNDSDTSSCVSSEDEVSIDDSDKDLVVEPPYNMNTLPEEVLMPDFTGNANDVDDDLFRTCVMSRKAHWISCFPRLKRPPDGNCLFKRSFIRETLKKAEPRLRRSCTKDLSGSHRPSSLDALTTMWPLELEDMFLEVIHYLNGVAGDTLQKILHSGVKIVTHVLFPEAMMSLISAKFAIGHDQAATAFLQKHLPESKT